MTWFKVDDNLATHYKVITAGNEAMGLWVRAASWSAQQLTDGRIPLNIVNMFGTMDQANKLVEAALWHRDGDGYEFNDWEDYQPTRAKVMAERAGAQERNRRAAERARGAKSSPKPSTDPRTAYAQTVFDEFWALYPRKVGKAEAFKTFSKLVDEWPAIIEGAERLKNDPNKPEAQYIPHPTTWLNRSGWHDEPYPAREMTKEESDRIALEQARIARDRERERSKQMREEMELARQNAVPAPDCKHGIALWRCLPCSKELAAQEAN